MRVSTKKIMDNAREIEICSRLLQHNLKELEKDPTVRPNVDLMWRRGHAYLRASIDTTTRPWGNVKDMDMYNKALVDFRAAHQIQYGTIQ